MGGLDTVQGTGAGRGSLIDARALMSIRNLELRARMVVEGFWKGIHRSPYHGFSVEFTEYRQYSPGDDPRYLDWRVFARSDRYFIKKFEEETNLRCYLVVDSSRSMSYGSTGYTKREYAATLAATLSLFLHLQGDAIGLLTFGAESGEYLPAKHRSGHLRHLMQTLERAPGGAGTDLGEPLKRLLEIMRKRSLVVLISDFLAPLDRFEPHLTSLSASGHDVIVFQVLDPAEMNFAFEKAVMFEDLETGGALYVDPVAVRKEYLNKLDQHCSALRKSCERLGVPCLQLGTDRPLELALFDFLRERMQRRRFSRASGTSRTHVSR